MNKHIVPVIALAAILMCIVSCAHVANRAPAEMEAMHKFLTRHDPTVCENYHYNFEREVPRLYAAHEIDSILDVIDYIKSECGPASNLEITRMLILSETGQFGDSLIGPSTVEQLLRYRAEQDYNRFWNDWYYPFDLRNHIDNTGDRFASFRAELADSIAVNAEVTQTERALALFYSGRFDSAMSVIQSDDMRGTPLRKSYDDLVADLRHRYGTRGNVALLAGDWIGQDNLTKLGNHPQLGLQLGVETRKWRFDLMVDYRFHHAKEIYEVDSLGHIVQTDEFNSWLIGVDVGFKLVDNALFSTDIFAGLGYDGVLSKMQEGDPNEHIYLNSVGASFGVRQRFFLDQRSGAYLGIQIRNSIVDYDNGVGSDLSGNALTVSVILGGSLHETLYRFLDLLNYKGSRRP